MVYFMAGKLSDYLIKQNVPYTRDNLDHGLKIIINFFFCVTIPITISLFMGNFIEVFSVLLLIGIMRTFSGGIHLKSSDLCVVYTTFLAVTIPVISDYLTDYITIINFISYGLILLFAPHDKEMEANKEQVIKYKAISFFIAVAATIIYPSSLISTALLVQTLHLIKVKGRVVQ